MATTTILLIVGILMIIASFATMTGIYTSPSDQNFAFLILILGIICIAAGLGYLNPLVEFVQDLDISFKF